ncbi:hypothetical protein [Actinacidiphila rubida]|uniref:hypothetical protein n=1 Tax=Actinacidiphila rubida TaxID=310780 RepID=UPI00114CE645|nr:hypothetical protein [Actinacidiphila rubida]
MVRVRAIRLDDETPAAVRDTTRLVDLAIDFSHPPGEITAALTALFQEAIDSKRWARREPPAGPTAAT